MPNLPAEYLRRIEAILTKLGITQDYGDQRQLSLQPEETDLEPARILSDGRTLMLHRSIVPLWQSMREAARVDGIDLLLISGFRSVEHQQRIITTKLAAGTPLEDILRVNAAPGYSEHHTGRAVDIGTPGCLPLTEAFEETAAFRWLARNGMNYGFRLSYPRGHPHGFVYEPWHWFARDSG